ncbi:MAG: ABC transporter permease [Ruminococcus sp.]|nr:ABC transporter permease [Ruminococcus sp.]
MKKKLLAVIGAVLFIVLGAVSVYISSYDNINNKKSGFVNREIPLQELEMDNWDTDGNGFVSREDPKIIKKAVSCYIHSLKVDGRWEGEEEISFFYTESPDEDFSEGKKLMLPYSIVNGRTYIYPKRQVYSMRIDLTEAAGAELSFKGIEINDRSPVLSFSRFMTICLFPTMVYAFIAAVMLLRGEVEVYGTVFKKYVPLLKNLIDRDLKVKYRRSVLGFLWSVLNPLLMALVVTVVFSKIFRFQVEYFTVFYLTGSLIFNFVAAATTSSMGSVLGAAGLIKKVYIPKYIFPLEKCLFEFINMLFSAVAVLAVIFIQGMPLKATALMFWVPMVYAFVFAFGLGLILASLTVFFRDMEHLYSVLVSVWMYLTPIIYPEEILPRTVRSLMKLNPMYHYVGYMRQVVMYGSVPGAAENMVCAAFSLMFLCAGLLFFKKTQDKFILYI